MSDDDDLDSEFDIKVDEEGYLATPFHEIEPLQRNAISLGVSVGVLAQLFNKTPAEVKKIVSSLTPKDYRNKKPVYDISEAAQLLVNPVIDVATWMKALKPSDIPAQLQKDFWQGQLTRQKFEAEAKHYWKTERVQFVLSQIFGIIRQRVMLFTDTVDQQTSLTPAQRQITQAMSDSLLKDISDNIRAEFAFYDHQDRDELLDADSMDVRQTDMRAAK